MRPWMKWSVIIFVGSAAMGAVQDEINRSQPQKPRPVLTKAQHDALECQVRWQQSGRVLVNEGGHFVSVDNVSAIEAVHMCGDPGPADAIDPYEYRAPKHHR